MEHKQFKPFNRVLVRISKESIWECDFYSYFRKNHEYPHRTLCHCFKDENILPYEGNEHLVGTTGEPEEEIELKEGEWLMVSNGTHANPSKWELREYIGFQLTIMVKNTDIVNALGFYKFAIRFKDFNPDDMEETSRHILCVRNGKIVRYKE